MQEVACECVCTTNTGQSCASLLLFCLRIIIITLLSRVMLYADKNSNRLAQVLFDLYNRTDLGTFTQEAVSSGMSCVYYIYTWWKLETASCVNSCS